jgi:hypothetical protein
MFSYLKMCIFLKQFNFIIPHKTSFFLYQYIYKIIYDWEIQSALSVTIEDIDMFVYLFIYGRYHSCTVAPKDKEH